MYNLGTWAGDAEISMISIVYEDLVVATYELITNSENNNILGYRFIQIYGNITDNSNSILILISINNLHWTCAFYNTNSQKVVSNFIIPEYILYKNKNKLIDKIEKNNLDINFNTEIKYKDEFDKFNNTFNNLKNKSLNEVSQFYS